MKQGIKFTLLSGVSGLALLAGCGGTNLDNNSDQAAAAPRIKLGGVVVAAASSFGLTQDTDYYTLDTGAGLVIKIRRTDNGVSTQSAGDIASMIYNGVQYQDQSRGSQLNSGFDYLYTGVSAVNVSATTVGTDAIKVTVTAGNLTHYYMVKSGVNNVSFRLRDDSR